MNNRDLQAFNKIDQLADCSRKHLFSLSPNDALVQISLPLVLILAIATKLMILSQSIAVQDKGPALLDLWKQQLILRVDKVMDNWERTAEFNAFPEFSRVQWQGNWPADERFKKLCTKATVLNNIDTLSHNIYYDALRYQPQESKGGTNESLAYLFKIYDPKAPNSPANKENIPEEFKITPERREFALKYIRKRCLTWKQHIEELQWALVASCAERSPITETWSDRQLAAQMRKLSETLQKQGYPLLLDLTSEYQHEEGNTK